MNVNLTMLFLPGSKFRTPRDGSHMTPGRDAPMIFANEEELKKLRFSRHVTAFDVDINSLDDHPWRNKNVDVLDFFNYGFNERTWMVNLFSLFLTIYDNYSQISFY